VDKCRVRKAINEISAVMRIRVTTPNVLKALRKRDPGAAKPYNFALSPILTQARPDVTLVAPFSKHPNDWLTRAYTRAKLEQTIEKLERDAHNSGH
jgi:hypothetical protein